MGESTAQMIYAEARRAIDVQVGLLANLRNRAGTILAASALATSFLAADVATLKTLTDWELWLPLGSFIGLAVLVVLVLLPWRNWTFVTSAKVLIEDHVRVESRNSPDALALFLAESLEAHYDGNATKLTRLYWLFRAACVLFAVEVIAWIVILSGKL